MKTIENIRIKATINKVFDYISVPEKQKLRQFCKQRIFDFNNFKNKNKYA